MRKFKRMPGLILTAIVILLPMLISAGNIGKIKGTVTDSKTGDPLNGVTVTVLGTTISAKTDIDGNFILVDVPAGKYQLKFTALKYKTVLIDDVEIKADKAVEVNVQMEEGVIDMGDVMKVMGKKEAIDFNQTGTVDIANEDYIVRSPVPTVDNLLKQGTGIVKDPEGELHIRGGRAGATYEINGTRRESCKPLPPPYPTPDEFDAMYFKNYGISPYNDTRYDNKSTFAADIDDASFILTRSYLERGAFPPPEAIRPEEFINHLNYEYPAPGHGTFSVSIEGAVSDFNPNSNLLRIGIKGKEIDPDNRQPATLIFVIDVSGSMRSENRLELVKESLRYLVDQMDRRDRIGIVTFESVARDILQPISMNDRREIYRAIGSLGPLGSTNLADGLKHGYQMAERNFDPNRINRIVLISDGVANTGMTDADDILKRIKRFADKGVTLSSIGVGMGNHNDALLEKLGDKGNGHYAYVDDLKEAKRVFVDNLTGMLQLIARDVKIQVEFDPSQVASWRLVGYENRDVADNKFRDDREDGGEIGSGHEVTALYEIYFQHRISGEEFGRVNIRFKDPRGEEVQEVHAPLKTKSMGRSFKAASPQFRMAVALAKFGEILKNSPYARNVSLAEVEQIFRDASRGFMNDEVRETSNVIRRAASMQTPVADYGEEYYEW